MKERWFSVLSSRRIAGRVMQCAAGLVGLAVLTLICYRAELNLATAGLVLMILLIGLSLVDNFLVSAVLSVAAIAALSFFFARPLFSFWVDNTKDLLALVTVLVVLLLVAGIRANRRRVAEALKRSEMYLAEAQRVSHTGSFGWNVRRGQLYWSEETFRIFGLDRTVSPTLDLVLERAHPDDRAPLAALLERVTREDRRWDLEHRLMMPDGSIKHIRVVAQQIAGEVGEHELVGAVMDITAIRRAEEERRQAQADLSRANRVMLVGELTASIAHEVNQPIAAAVTNANACIRWLGAQPPDLAEALQALGRIVRNGNQAVAVINRIRGLLNKMPSQRDPIDVNEVILEVIGLTQGDMQRHAIRLHQELAAGLPLVIADKVQMQQVILNLVINAVEAMHTVDDHPRDLVLHTGIDDGGQLCIEVRDSGPGLDEAALDRIFESFYTTKTGGIGMGLAISRSIAEAHGGRLVAAPNTPRGAVFRFTLPLRAAA
jgi:C4-dicarboxylate-specific signal transduction histidine kinase